MRDFSFLNKFSKFWFFYLQSLRHVHVNCLFYYSDFCYDTSTLMGNNWIVRWQIFLKEFFFCRNWYDLQPWIMHKVSDLSYGIDLWCDHQMLLQPDDFTIGTFDSRSFYSYRNWFIEWEDKMIFRCISLTIVILKLVE